jgi:hypothetical protein
MGLTPPKIFWGGKAAKKIYPAPSRGRLAAIGGIMPQALLAGQVCAPRI